MDISTFTVLNLLFTLVWLLSIGFFAVQRLKRYLHIFQQDDYNGTRFLKWINATKTYDRRATLGLITTAGFSYYFDDQILSNYGLTAIQSIGLPLVFVLIGYLEPNPCLEAKKKLVLTERARRILISAVVTSLCFSAPIFLYCSSATAVLWVQLLPVFLVMGNILLKPYEQKIQQQIMSEAKDKLLEISPTVIGITGSFGKTSVKHILGHVLEMNDKTLYTPGSVNTLMGISRIIRENLMKGCRYFLVEMGAYGVGSIGKLCDLTPPNVGIITALGEAHYERFKTLDAVAKAKFELAERVLAQPDGKVIIHESVMEQSYAREFVLQNRAGFLICGTGDQADLIVTEVKQTALGLNLTIKWQGQSHLVFAPLFGLHHAENIILAIATSLAVGVTLDRAITALRTVPQIRHRLQVKPHPTGITYVDDAFNSNPRGFVSAVHLLSHLAKDKGGRGILVTPGVAELGARHDAVHAELGAQTAQCADVVIAVVSDRIPTFCEAFQKATSNPIICVSSLIEAQTWLRANAKANDVILFENDLPDVYEQKLTI